MTNMILRSVLLIGLFMSLSSEALARPNILFIAIDDMKPLIGAYGEEEAVTPNLDKLATESTVFQNAYTQWPVCGPSRASLMTGTRPETNGIMNLKDKLRKVSPQMVTLPEFLKSMGYFTAASGKIYDPRNMDSRQKHDAQSWSVPYENPKSKADKSGEDKLAVQIIDAPDRQFIDGDILDKGLGLLEQAGKQDKPFFVAVGFKKPHLPFACPKRFFDIYDPKDLPVAKFQEMPKGGLEKYISFQSGELVGSYGRGPNGQKYKSGDISEADQRHLLHGYYACTSFIDDLVGKLLTGLEKTGKADNTVVVLWGDHGFHLGDHGMWGKHTVMEQAAIVPLYFRVPGAKAQTVSAMAELTDMFPTIVELAGLEMPAQVEGISQLPVIEGRADSVRDAAVTTFKRKGARAYSMRTTGYRYTEWIKPSGELVYTELYDLDNNPLETVNLAAQKGNEALLKRMATLLRQDKRGLNLLK